MWLNLLEIFGGYTYLCYFLTGKYTYLYYCYACLCYLNCINLPKSVNLNFWIFFSPCCYFIEISYKLVKSGELLIKYIDLLEENIIFVLSFAPSLVKSYS